MDNIIIWGATGQCIVLEELLHSYSLTIDAIFDNNESIGSPFENIPIYYKKEGFLNWLKTKNNIENYYYLVAIGGANGNIRISISNMLESYGIQPYNAIHKTAFVAYNSKIGSGCQILANVSICAKVEIGKNCIINTSASIDHECILSDGVHIGPGAKLAGCVEVEENVFIGTNATILPRIKIGKCSIVGAGAVVTKDIPPYTIVAGNPAIVLRTIQPTQIKS